MENKDIFDRIMDFRLFRPFQGIYRKYKSVLLYLFFGVCTTVINFIIYHICCNTLHISNVPSNIIAWICSVTFAYFTNRDYVFESAETDRLKEMASFYGGRLTTGVLETVIMYVAVDVMHLNNSVCKICANIIVIILNYVISKLFVFNSGKKKD